MSEIVIRGTGRGGYTSYPRETSPRIALYLRIGLSPRLRGDVEDILRKFQSISTFAKEGEGCLLGLKHPEGVSVIVGGPFKDEYGRGTYFSVDFMGEKNLGKAVYTVFTFLEEGSYFTRKTVNIMDKREEVLEKIRNLHRGGLERILTVPEDASMVEISRGKRFQEEGEVPCMEEIVSRKVKGVFGKKEVVRKRISVFHPMKERSLEKGWVMVPYKVKETFEEVEERKL